MKRFCFVVISLMTLGLTPSFPQNPVTTVSEGLFLLVSGDIPTYPQLAVAARVEGTVEVQATVVQGTVTKADSTSTSNALLSTAATNTVMSWRFDPEQSGTLKVTFSYELSKEQALRRENPEIQMKLPRLVRLIAKPVRPTTLR